MRAAGFIGLGQIGRPMAQRLADWPAGLWVYDIDETASKALAADGATVAASPRDVASHADYVSVMVRDDAQVRDVFTGADGILAGAHSGCVVAVHSTVHPDTVTELSALAAPHGVRVLDAPVSGGAIGALQGSLAILVGGAEADFRAAEEALGRMGELVVYVGPVGAGTAAKLARNLLHFVAITAVTEAAALASAAGIDLLTLGEVVRHTDAITGGPGAIMRRPASGPVSPDDPWFAILDHVRALGEKDLALAVELAGRLGVETPLAELSLDRLAAGLGVAVQR